MIISCGGVQSIAIQEQAKPFKELIQFSPQPAWYRKVKTHLIGGVGGIADVGGLKDVSELGQGYAQCLRFGVTFEAQGLC